MALPISGSVERIAKQMSGTGLVTSNTMPVSPNWTTVFYLSADLSQIDNTFVSPFEDFQVSSGEGTSTEPSTSAASRVGISWWILSAHQLANGSLVLLSGYKNKGLGAGPQKSQQWVLVGPTRPCKPRFPPLNRRSGWTTSSASL